MKRTILLALTTLMISVSCLLMPLTSLSAAAATPDSKAKSEICGGVGLVGGDDSCGDGGKTFKNAIMVAISWLAFAVGFVAVIMIIVAGLLFVTAGGDSGKVTAARNTIIQALIGLAIVAFAEVIVHFVLATATNAAS